MRSTIKRGPRTVGLIRQRQKEAALRRQHIERLQSCGPLFRMAGIGGHQAPQPSRFAVSAVSAQHVPAGSNSPFDWKA